MIAQGAAVHVCDVAADALADALAANRGLSGTLADVAVSDDVARLFARQAAARGISEAEVREEMTRFISLRTMIDPKGVAEMVAFLASDAAAQVTGQSIGVCGNTEWEA
ncbi:SDR family oxidoreductase [Sphingosinicella microcystinivorans]|uniref:SDR family oxidoreductase n=1 Tax=Sphingosinicella microcystinivorans TaxID=335406 RepID=UPI0022F38154|nr:SDR family oxidoreductase [Sphingosinicella microcystinivorans]WBX84307.1 SDR family oxidoreductase [Sphingosinicella microcystinivorans]